MDGDLGAFHGLNFADFTLLYLLMQADHGRLPMKALARSLGLPMSALVRRMVLLEKTGHAQRISDPEANTQRHAVLRPGGRQLVQGAIATVEAHCKEAVHSINPANFSAAYSTLLDMCGHMDAHV
jgi:DNA-binding MarR family transcriptional regulator